METATLLVNLIIALFFGLLMAFIFKRKNPWGFFWIFFLIIFFAALAGGLWIRPVGPLIMGVAWLPVFAMALLMALLIAASTTETTDPVKESEVSASNNTLTISTLVWVLLILLVLSVVGGYIIR